MTGANILEPTLDARSHAGRIGVAMPPSEINGALIARDIIGGLDVSDAVRHRMLLCATELNTRAEIDALIDALQESGTNR